MTRITNTVAKKDPRKTTMADKGFIKKQNLKGQEELCDSEQLPRFGYGPSDSKGMLEKLGVNIVGPSAGDPLFFDVVLPAGWSIQKTHLDLWNTLHDDSGLVRARIFYKALYWDRRAYLKLE